jgi:hypothetical protein
MMIGTAVPRQTELADLPPEATEVLNGYWGSQYDSASFSSRKHLGLVRGQPNPMGPAAALNKSCGSNNGTQQIDHA